MAKRRKKTEAEAPTCNCLLLCDDVLVSQGKGKHFLQGIIGTIVVQTLPAIVGGYVAYVRVSNVYGAQKIKLSFEKANDNQVLLEAETAFPQQAEPLGVYTIVVPVPSFVVEEAGRYLFSATYGGVPIAQSPIEIRLAEARSEP